MSATDDLLHNNQEYADRFDDAGLPAPPRRKVAIVTCMDARLDPALVLGLQPGDAHVIRNAGGVITDDEIRSLAISQHELGTEEVLLIQHTGCGLLSITDDGFRDKLEQVAGERPEWHSGAFPDLEASVRDSVRQVVESPFIPHTGSVRGFVYEVETGRLREVV